MGNQNYNQGVLLIKMKRMKEVKEALKKSEQIYLTSLCSF